jgi:hypothetical protein
MIKIILSIIIQLNLSYYTTPTKSQIYDEIVKQDVLFPEICWQQAGAETSWGTTGVGKSRNNLFGFRNKSGYLYFDSYISSVSYYKDWQDRKYPKHLEVAHKSSNCDYYCFLRSIGFKTGKSNNIKEKSYTDYLRRIKINFNE